MARKPRFALHGYPQHVIQRGNNREACFFDESDRRKYLASLVESAGRMQRRDETLIWWKGSPGTLLVNGFLRKRGAGSGQGDRRSVATNGLSVPKTYAAFGR